MKLCIFTLTFFYYLSLLVSCTTGDPTLYEYYTEGGIKSGLKADNADHFILNGRPLIIFGGSLHYFRHPHQYWSRLLKQYRAAGLNTVQLYIPWNEHEDLPGRFDFGEHSEQLNLDRLLTEIKRADLFAVVRPGPYICAEWDFGGLPSWLLREPNIALRTFNVPYLNRVKQYWKAVFNVINRHQFSVSGGPVLMVQLENEYGAYISENKKQQERDNNAKYLQYLRNLTLESGFTQQLFTSDNIIYSDQNPTRNIFPAEDNVLETANFGQDEGAIDAKLVNMSRAQPNRPLYVSEYWSGWFDAWSYKRHNHSHQTTDPKTLVSVAEKIIRAHNGSVNFYPFIGGTNFGFQNGFAYSDGNDDNFWVTTSYDYDAPISESHQYTEKYHLIKQLYSRLVSIGHLPKLNLPPVPPEPKLIAYKAIEIKEVLPFENILNAATKFTLKKAVSMELLELGPGYGQRYGFINYRVVADKRVKNYAIKGPIQDRGILLVDGFEQAVVFNEPNCSIDISTLADNGSNANQHTFDMLVENMGRENHFSSFPTADLKGINSPILLDGVKPASLEVYSLDFNSTFMSNLENQNWKLMSPEKSTNENSGPALYKGELQLLEQPKDTYLLMDGWTKGNVFVNDLNIGRYWSVGPQRALYLPGVYLKKGLNTIKVFEQHKAKKQLTFVDEPAWTN